MIFSEKSETPNLTDYLKAKPDSVVYYGDKKSTASWQLLYFIALKLIAAKHPDELMRLEGKSILGDKIEIGSEIEIREFSHPLGIMRKPDGKWLFAETDFNVQQILLRLKKLMEISVANFKLRQGTPIGCKVTLRGERMYEFVDRFFNIALPRVRDFRGINGNGFDGRGNFACGIKEQIIFPEIDFEKVDAVRGMDVCFVTTAKTDEEGKELLKALGAPFATENN